MYYIYRDVTMKKTDLSEMPSFIRERRKALGMSLDDLASLTGTSKSHIWAIESGGAKNPTVQMLLAIADSLQCSIGELIGADIGQPSITIDEMRLIAAHRRIFDMQEP